MDWIGLRAERRAAVTPVDCADIDAAGLVGDHGREGKRAVTLFQAEHLSVIASILGINQIHAKDLRRNIHVRGLNLSALRHVPLRIGSAVVEITVPCAPCSRMQEVFGYGGYNALRGHGGWCAKVIQPGRVCQSDSVTRA